MENVSHGGSKEGKMEIENTKKEPKEVVHSVLVYLSDLDWIFVSQDASGRYQLSFKI
jgi:hypothetical protein